MRRIRVPEIVLGALVASSIWACVMLLQAQKSEPSNDAEPAKTEQQHAVAGSATSQHEERPKAYQKSNWYDTFLNHTPDWFVAVFTALLTFVTYRLVSSTNKLWEAGERQIELARETAAAQSRDMQTSIAVAHRSADLAEKALLSVEIPYLYPFVRRHGFVTNVSGRTGQQVVTSLSYRRGFIEFYFKNFGRTPAEIIEVQSILLPSMGMPRPYPAMDDRIIMRMSGEIVPADGGESRDFPYDFNKGMFDTYSEGRYNPNTHLFWFLGFVRYQDVFENEYVRGFCLCYSPMTDRFYPVGDDGYNYRKKTKAAGQPTQSQDSPM